VITRFALVLAVTAMGCASLPGDDEIMRAIHEEQRAADLEQAREDAKYALFDQFESSPDLPAWHAQRAELALALGDRRFDQPFDAVYDAMLVALASTGCRVFQTERASGYITATAPALPPAQKQQIDEATLRDYAAAKGFPADVLEPLADPANEPMNVSALVARYLGGLTISLIRQGDGASKAKLRFNDVYYPPLIEAYYAAVWSATDKQLFLDRGLD
jgi:hypothetical protein